MKGLRSLSFLASDCGLCLPAFVLMLFGLCMVASASFAVAHQMRGSPFYFLLHQGAFFVLALLVMWLVVSQPIQRWLRLAPYLLLQSPTQPNTR